MGVFEPDKEIYLKDTLEKAKIKAIISNGKSKMYKLDNGMMVGKNAMVLDMPKKKKTIKPVSKKESKQENKD